MNFSLPSFMPVMLMTLIVVSCDSEKTNNSVISSNKNASNSIELEEKLFSLLPSAKTNIEFANMLVESEEMNIIRYHYFYNGGGVACGDINNDGLTDLYFTSNQNEDKLYLNKGNLEFEDVSHILPPHDKMSWTTGVSMADINDDGYLDIYVCRSGNLPPEKRRNVLLMNQGELKFEEQGQELGLNDAGYSTISGFLDYDRDGDLDMFLVNHNIIEITNFDKTLRQTESHPFVGDKLYRNDNSKFTDVSEEAGIIGNSYGYGLDVSFSDVNQDGWPDIYVTNDFNENDYLYLNQGDGSFVESIKNSTQHISNFGMGVDIADFNNDDMTDILVVDMVARDNFRQKTNMSGMDIEKFREAIEFGFHRQYMYNTLQMNQGNSKFSEVGQMTGISNTDWSWSALIADYDNDGLKDILITNGLRKDVRNNDFVKEYLEKAVEMTKNKGRNNLNILYKLLDELPSQKLSNYSFQNRGDLHFEDRTKNWGLQIPAFSTGAAWADLDNDGDLDLVLNNVDDKAFVYRNNAKELNGNDHIQVVLQGLKGNRNGVGSRVQLNTSNACQSIELFSNRGFQSSVPLIAHFGIDKGSKVESLKVLWPNGETTEISNPEINKRHVISYAKGKKAAVVSKNLVFEDVTDKLGINYRHVENEYDDYKVQVLLPHKLSMLGPALAAGDVNGDGLDDFFIGGAKGSVGALFLQVEGNRFKKIPFYPDHIEYEDLDACFFDADGDSDLDLYVASGGYEIDENSDFVQDRLYVNDGNGNFLYAPERLPEVHTSTACIAPCDFDSDGDMDLFIGGRLLSKKYPFSPNSYLLKNENGIYTDVTSQIAPELSEVGMVTDAVWIDPTGSKQNKLIVLGEWMNVKMFQFENGVISKISDKETWLDKTNGWWNCISTGDFDNDGDLDFIAGNLGLNYKYKASLQSPFKIIAGDFDENQKTDLVLSFEENNNYYPVRGRECSSQQLPFIKKKFPDYNSFAIASVDQILGPDLPEDAIELNVYTFATTLFENQGDFNFIPRQLNSDVQISSVNDILVVDLNGDQIDDFVMAGNLLQSEVETPRNDAGYGNILLGKGDNEYHSIRPSRFRYFGQGEVRKMRKLKTENGYVILVAKNNAMLKAYKPVGEFAH